MFSGCFEEIMILHPNCLLYKSWDVLWLFSTVLVFLCYKSSTQHIWDRLSCNISYWFWILTLVNMFHKSMYSKFLFFLEYIQFAIVFFIDVRNIIIIFTSNNYFLNIMETFQRVRALKVIYGCIVFFNTRWLYKYILLNMHDGFYLHVCYCCMIIIDVLYLVFH